MQGQWLYWVDWNHLSLGWWLLYTIISNLFHRSFYRMLTSADTVTESTSMLPKPGRTSPSRGALHTSPAKSASNSFSWSSQGGRSPTTTQSSSTANRSPGRGHRGAPDLTTPNTVGKDSTPYHPHRSAVSTHHCSHHGSNHHYNHRDSAGHTGNELLGHNTHGSTVNPTHACNSNYHGYANHNHSGHNGSFRPPNPAHQLRDFLLVRKLFVKAA